MGYQARWGPKGFIISTSKIVAIEGFQTGYALKTDTNADTSGTPPTNTKGRELQTVSFSTTYLREAGTDPRGQLAEWDAQVGNAYPLYIGGKVFGPKKLQLQDVSVTDVLFDNAGNMIKCKVGLTFKEYSASSVTNGATTKKSGATAYTTEELKAMAFDSKASAEDKATKKPTSYTGGTRGAR